jgi:glycosyltransferase involved in cell wall biosynthesis
MELNIEKSVKFIGSLNYEEVAKQMRSACVFVLPSMEEAFGNVVLEAMASGTPVIASKVGGIPDLLDETCGILVEPGNHHELAKGIMSLIGNKKKWISYSKAAIFRAQTDCISWGENSNRYIKIYREISDKTADCQ